MTALHALLVPWLGSGHNVLFMLGTVVVALATAGAGPAIVTAILVFVVFQWLFVGDGAWAALMKPNGATSAMLYALVCALMITLAWWHTRRARREREAHARDVQMLELVTDCFFVLDRQWRFTRVNDPALRYFSLKGPDMLGQVMWEKFPMTLGTPIETLFREVDRSGEAARA